MDFLQKHLITHDLTIQKQPANPPFFDLLFHFAYYFIFRFCDNIHSLVDFLKKTIFDRFQMYIFHKASHLVAIRKFFLFLNFHVIVPVL